MTSRTIEISESQGAQIDALIADGLLVTGNDIIESGLRHAQKQRAKHAKKLEALLAAAQVGIDDIEAGRCYKFESAQELEAFVFQAFNEGLEQAREAQSQPSLPTKVA